MHEANDTIAAISTAPGECGISVVRMSGAKAVDTASKILCLKGGDIFSQTGWTFRYGHVVNSAGEHIDEVIVLVYKAPHSYTREDIVEIQCHGGRTSAKRILETLVHAGVRVAEPGEFTKRAFLNGRLDLIQAEAVIDLIKARTELAACAAMEQLDGHLSSVLTKTYNDITRAAAVIEARLDFSEDDLTEDCRDEAGTLVTTAVDDIEKILKGWEEGRIIREGITAVITGRPNAGKSTLLNALLGVNRAIVSEQPGTTRDTIEEDMVIGGILVRLIDTAGLRPTDCSVEREGVERARDWMRRAELNIHVIDASVEPDAGEVALVSGLDRDKLLIILNKVDLGRKTTTGDLDGLDVLETCLLKEDSVHAMRDHVERKLMKQKGGEPHALTTARQYQGIKEALEALRTPLEILSAGTEDVLVVAAQGLRVSAESIGKVIGRAYSEDLLASIFDAFCIGK